MIECTKCGCPESRELSRASLWGAPVSLRICANCGSRFRVEMPETNDNGAENNGGGVIFQAVRCPKCKCKRCPVTSTRLPVRHHKCKKCGHGFKSVEAD